MGSTPADNTTPDVSTSAIIDDLAERGWSVRDDLLPGEVCDRLAFEAWEEWQTGAFRRARVGTGITRRLRSEIRNDHVQWLDPLALSPAQQHYFDIIQNLRQAINLGLMMGLYDFEAHFALYTPGAFYAKHLDQFIGAHHRVVTSILYLNRDWLPADGGALRLYTGDAGAGEEHIDILPKHGRMLTFLSGRFFHEVLPAKRPRISLTGWHSIRPLGREGWS